MGQVTRQFALWCLDEGFQYLHHFLWNTVVRKVNTLICTPRAAILFFEGDPGSAGSPNFWGLRISPKPQFHRRLKYIMSTFLCLSPWRMCINCLFHSNFGCDEGAGQGPAMQTFCSLSNNGAGQ